MLKDIGKLKALWGRFLNKDYREAFADARLREAVAAQVYFIRESRKLTQGELAALAGTQQPAISRIERGEAALSVTTLQKVARAFDVALSVRFVSYSEIADEVVSDRIEAYVAPFADDTPAGLAVAYSTQPPRLRYSVWEDCTGDVLTTPSAPLHSRGAMAGAHV